MLLSQEISPDLALPQNENQLVNEKGAGFVNPKINALLLELCVHPSNNHLHKATWERLDTYDLYQAIKNFRRELEALSQLKFTADHPTQPLVLPGTNIEYYEYWVPAINTTIVSYFATVLGDQKVRTNSICVEYVELVARCLKYPDQCISLTSHYLILIPSNMI